ncbi:hypothetical protein HOT31_gp096 [Microbacterium phage Hendrix]|uniref:Uncharacterized protein n=1 Tax=Microbacterium phage Hendrix TaxID=2182341 RepID=A0A2U8UUL3_9CAUD|nr:hypothetical protein HOT31_gp096 [Microbacterium phage Hendrix]AWN07767.1 hypothetical protein PBI_HENDRIX_96 [Microbacterium phage Hendrix]
MMISTVGDLKKALLWLEDDDQLVLSVRGERVQFPSVTEVVGYHGSWGPAFLYYHGEPRNEEPLTVFVVLGESIDTTHNERIARNRGTHVSVKDVRRAKQLDPKPWVYTDPVSGKKTRLPARRLDVETKFDPRYGYVKDEEAYS